MKFFRAKSILIVILTAIIIITAIVLAFSWHKSKRNRTDEPFLNSLKGEIVYAKRDGGSSNIYKISANGTNKKLLYHNEDKVNSSSFQPRWSDDGSKIYFTAAENGKLRTFWIDSNGNKLTGSFKSEKGYYGSGSRSRSDDIIVEQGSVYYLNEQGRK